MRDDACKVGIDTAKPKIVGEGILGFLDLCWCDVMRCDAMRKNEIAHNDRTVFLLDHEREEVHSWQMS